MARIFFIPVKYPRITDDTQTKNSDGASARITYCEPSIFITYCAKISAPKNNTKVVASPITENSSIAVLKILCAPAWSLSATLSDTIFEIALGIPTDDIASSTV